MKTRSSAPDVHSNTFQISECVVDPQRNRITRGGEVVRVEPKVMDLLVALCLRPGEVVAKEELFQALWPQTFVSEHVLTHAVWQLRQALGNRKLIESVPKRGYRLAGELRHTDATPDHNGASPIPYQRFGIAVLPLANLSGDPAQEYFSDGMTEALILRLAQIQSLRVISRMSIMRYKGHAKSSSEIRAELNVDAVIEGSVFRYENRVRISVELIDTKRNLRILLHIEEVV